MAKRYKITEQVEMIDNIDEAITVMQKVEKAALRDVGNLMRKKIKERIRDEGIVHSGRFANHVTSYLFRDRETGLVTLRFGVLTRAAVMKNGKQPSHANPHWVEYGVHPHKITAKGMPKGATVLAYQEQDVVYGKTVKHPGTTGTHVFEKTVNESHDEMQKVIEKRIVLANVILEKGGVIPEGKDNELEW